MKKLVLNALAMLVISGGAAHLYATTTDPACCTAGNGQKCCGRTCGADATSCCADSGCQIQPT